MRFPMVTGLIVCLSLALASCNSQEPVDAQTALKSRGVGGDMLQAVQRPIEGLPTARVEEGTCKETLEFVRCPGRCNRPLER